MVLVFYPVLYPEIRQIGKDLTSEKGPKLEQ